MSFLGIGTAIGAVESLVSALGGGSSSASSSSASSGSLGTFTSPMQSVFAQFGQGTGQSVLSELIDNGDDDAAAAGGLAGAAASLA
jgi:hypothetical protein